MVHEHWQTQSSLCNSFSFLTIKYKPFSINSFLSFHVLSPPTEQRPFISTVSIVHVTLPASSFFPLYSHSCDVINITVQLSTSDTSLNATENKSSSPIGCVILSASSVPPQPNAGQGRLIRDVSRWHNAVGRTLCTRDRPSTWQHTTLTIDRRPSRRQDSNPQSQQSVVFDRSVTLLQEPLNRGLLLRDRVGTYTSIDVSPEPAATDFKVKEYTGSCVP